MYSNFLNKSKILAQVHESRVFVLNTVDSTNQYIIDNIKYMGLGDVCVAEYQTLGRGRFDKLWIASFGNNICLSMYWKFNGMFPSTIVKFSVIVSIIVAEVLKDLGVLQIKIKWPNDLYVNKKKLAGILIETIMERTNVAHIIIGIGINLSINTDRKLMSKINANWISLEDLGIFVDRNVLVAILINTLCQRLQYFEYYGFKLCIPYWKKFDFLYKKPVMLLIQGNGEIKKGVAFGINSHGALIVHSLNKTHYCVNNNVSVNFYEKFQESIN